MREYIPKFINRLLSRFGINNKGLIEDSFNTTLVQIAGFVLGVFTSIFFKQNKRGIGSGIKRKYRQLIKQLNTSPVYKEYLSQNDVYK